jgi:Phage-related protein
MGKKISDYIRLFPKDQSFTSDPTVLNLSNKIGICILDGVISAKISEEINGAYEATIEYDMDNRWFKEIKKDRLIVMRVDPYDSKPAQIFRIYSISRNLMSNTCNYNRQAYFLRFE